MTATKAQDRVHTRMLSIELLRIVAMLGIAVFHTFQPSFENTVSYENPGGFSSPALAVLGCIDQLGAWGNHVFIMISGCFLLPRALQETDDVSQRKQTLRRARNILLTVALYTAAALLVGIRYPKATSLGDGNLVWLAKGLQFIWIYLLLVALCPTIARAWRRCTRPTATLAALTVLVYGINLYIAFVSPGDAQRELWEWRKLMSGVTYALSFVMGGWLAQHRAHCMRSPLLLFLLVATATAAAEAQAAWHGSLGLLEALSYKSTSPFACALAAAALACAQAAPAPRRQHPRLVRLVAFFTSGMLGFYVLQALFSRGWHQVSNALLETAAEAGFGSFLACGVAFSAILLLAFVSLDALLRQFLPGSRPAKN